MAPTARIMFSNSRQPSLSAEREFFCALRTADGVFKTTGDRRMDDVNEAFARCQSALARNPIEILDVAVSSGVSTAEWRDDLKTRGVDARITATDLMIDGRLTKMAPGYYVLTDSLGRVLQHDLFGLAVRPYTSGKLFHDLVTWIANSLYKVVRLGRRGDDGVAVKLVSAKARDIDLVEDDLFGGNPAFARRFDAIRAANVLNLGYFPEQRLADAVVNLKQRLKGPGAIFIVNRTHDDGANHATLFELTPDSAFCVHSRVGQGSEIERLVLAA